MLDEYNVSTTSNVLSPFNVVDENLRINLFEERRNDGDKNGDQVAAKQTKDGNQDEEMERKEHPILELFNNSLHINEGPITKAKAKNIKETLNELIENVKTMVALEVDLDKRKSHSEVNLVQVIDELK